MKVNVFFFFLFGLVKETMSYWVQVVFSGNFIEIDMDSRTSGTKIYLKGRRFDFIQPAVNVKNFDNISINDIITF